MFSTGPCPWTYYVFFIRILISVFIRILISVLFFISLAAAVIEISYALSRPPGFNGHLVSKAELFHWKRPFEFLDYLNITKCQYSRSGSSYVPAVPSWPSSAWSSLPSTSPRQSRGQRSRKWSPSQNSPPPSPWLPSSSSSSSSPLIS